MNTARGSRRMPKGLSALARRLGLDLPRASHRPSARVRAGRALRGTGRAARHVSRVEAMSWLGNLSFGAPWILAALIVLPAIWWLLRVTPPPPQARGVSAAAFAAGTFGKRRNTGAHAALAAAVAAADRGAGDPRACRADVRGNAKRRGRTGRWCCSSTMAGRRRTTGKHAPMRWTKHCARPHAMGAPLRLSPLPIQYTAYHCWMPAKRFALRTAWCRSPGCRIAGVRFGVLAKTKFSARPDILWLERWARSCRCGRGAIRAGEDRDGEDLRRRAGARRACALAAEQCHRRLHRQATRASAQGERGVEDRGAGSAWRDACRQRT